MDRDSTHRVRRLSCYVSLFGKRVNTIEALKNSNHTTSQALEGRSSYGVPFPSLSEPVVSLPELALHIKLLIKLT